MIISIIRAIERGESPEQHGTEIPKALQGRDPEGKTPLIASIESDDRVWFELLLDRVLDVNESEFPQLRTPLMWASMKQRHWAFDALIEKGADVHAVDSHGNSALIYASFWGDIHCMQHLVERGADPLHANTQEENALEFSVREHRYDALKWLLDNKFAWKQEQISRALFVAAELGIGEGLKTLLALVKNPNSIRFDGLNVFHKLALHEHVDLLKEVSAEFSGSLHSRDDYGNHLTHYATAASNKDLLLWLAEMNLVSLAENNDQLTPLDYCTDGELRSLLLELTK